MGLTSFLKKKLEGDPEEKAHRQTVKQAYTDRLRSAEIAGAKQAGTTAGFKKGQNYKSGHSGTLGMLAAGAEGAVVGINKGAATFNQGIGINDFQPARGNNDLLDLAPAHTSRRHEKHHRHRHQEHQHREKEFSDYIKFFNLAQNGVKYRLGADGRAHRVISREEKEQKEFELW